MNALKKAKVFLSLGTNTGNRKINLRKTCFFLKTEISNITISRVYETLPLYVENQPKFLNCVVSGETDKSPYSLLDYCLDLENRLGRDRAHKPEKGPRVIDIDILLYNSEIIHNNRLHIPHPGMYEREFVLIPLLELDPEIKDPETGYSFTIFLDKLKGQGVSLYAEPECLFNNRDTL